MLLITHYSLFIIHSYSPVNGSHRSEAQIAVDMGVTQQVISKRKRRILSTGDKFPPHPSERLRKMK
jgi:hypothetical protein